MDRLRSIKVGKDDPPSSQAWPLAQIGLPIGVFEPHRAESQSLLVPSPRRTGRPANSKESARISTAATLLSQRISTRTAGPPS